MGVLLGLALFVLVVYCCIRLWYCYIRFWAWLGGAIGEAIGRVIDKRTAHMYRDQRNDLINVTLCREKNTYFDEVLEDIQREKHRNK